MSRKNREYFTNLNSVSYGVLKVMSLIGDAFGTKATSILVALLLAFFALRSQDPTLNKIKIPKQPETKLTAIIFLGVDCPISQRYLARIKSIRGQYPIPDLKIIGIIPGKIKKIEIDSFSTTYKIDFPLYTDKRYHISEYLRAEITPEVLLFNHEGILKYQGAIDNWYYDLGHSRAQQTENYLIEAINSLLQGCDPSIKKTKAIGCIIQSSNKNK